MPHPARRQALAWLGRSAPATLRTRHGGPFLISRGFTSTISPLADGPQEPISPPPDPRSRKTVSDALKSTLGKHYDPTTTAPPGSTPNTSPNSSSSQSSGMSADVSSDTVSLLSSILPASARPGSTPGSGPPAPSSPSRSPFSPPPSSARSSLFSSSTSDLGFDSTYDRFNAHYVIQVTSTQNNTHMTLSLLPSEAANTMGFFDTPTTVNQRRGQQKNDDFSLDLGGDEFESSGGTKPSLGAGSPWESSSNRSKNLPLTRARLPPSKLLLSLSVGNLGYVKAQRQTNEAAVQLAHRFLMMMNVFLFRSRKPPEQSSRRGKKGGSGEEGGEEKKEKMTGPPFPVKCKPLETAPRPTDISIFFRGFGKGREAVAGVLGVGGTDAGDATGRGAENSDMRLLVKRVGDNTRLVTAGTRLRRRRNV